LDSRSKDRFYRVKLGLGLGLRQIGISGHGLNIRLILNHSDTSFFSFHTGSDSSLKFIVRIWYSRGWVGFHILTWFLSHAHSKYSLKLIIFISTAGYGLERKLLLLVRISLRRVKLARPTENSISYSRGH
jgi:hypothetical protein